MTSPMTRPRPQYQRGVALAVVLILLLVMTLLGLAAMRGTLMEERMSANQYDRSLSFQAVEAALREGEAVANNKPSLPSTGCQNGLCAKPIATDPDRWLVSGFWDDASGNWREATVTLGTLTAKPRYIVELLADDVPGSSCTTSGDVSPDAGCTQLESRYRITARSQAANRAEVILQSIYKVP